MSTIDNYAGITSTNQNILVMELEVLSDLVLEYV